MKNRKLGILTLLVLASVASLAEAQRPSVNSLLPGPATLGRHGLERAWWGHAVIDPTRDHVAHLTMDEEMVFVQSSAGIVTAFDAENGRQLWATKVGRFDEPMQPATSNDTQVLIVTGTRLIAIDKANGQITWDVRLPAQASTGPTVDDFRCYIGTLDGSLYALNLRKIRDLYSNHLLPKYSRETVEWRYKAGKEVTSPAISSGGRVNFASRDGSVYCVGAEKRDLLYQFESDGAILAGLTKLGKRQYAASEDFNFYCLDAANGRLLWQFSNSLPIRKTPYVVQDNLFLAPDRGGFYNLSAETGARKWWVPSLTRFVGIVGDKVFASDSENNLVMVARETGSHLGMLPLRDYTIRFPNDRTDRIYMATSTGVVLALKGARNQFARYYKYPERRPILPMLDPGEGKELPPDETLPAN